MKILPWLALAGALAGCSGSSSGELDIQIGKEQATKMKVGAAFVNLQARELDDNGNPGAYELEVYAFNDGVKDATCDTEPDDNKLVGGTNWAIYLSPDGEWTVGSQDALAPHITFFYKDGDGPRQATPWAIPSMQKDELFVESFSEKAITFRTDINVTGRLDGDSFVHGTFTAKVCKIEK